VSVPEGHPDHCNLCRKRHGLPPLFVVDEPEPMPKKIPTRLFVVTGCHSCPNIKSERTEGAGDALDYTCKATGKTVAGYVEYASELRKNGDFPKWCPLKAATTK
jgi:hypothetical protein